MDTDEQIRNGMDLAESQGHELSRNVIVSDVTQLHEIIEELKAIGYAVEGEFSTVLTEEGHAIRNTVKVRPSESLIAKLSRLLSIKVDLSLKDMFGPD